MRIATLLPAATEIIAALGAADDLVAISHECDFPPSVTHLPRLTFSPIDVAGSSARIDADVRQLHAAGRPVIAVDAAVLAALAPDLLVTQGLCDVCAVSDGEVMRLATALPNGPRVVTLGGRDLDGVFADIRSLGALLGREREAAVLLADGAARLAALHATAPSTAPRVLAIEWTEPPYLAGHWVPDLIRHAGGTDIGAAPGRHSRVVPWSDMRRLAPDVILVMLCGFSLARAREELAGVTDPEALALLASAPVWLLDGNAYTSRPGPRLVDAAELMQRALLGREHEHVERWHAGATAA
jgi:iron complex transport system substrate-binding protein